jgi:hypothetical protein
MSVNGWGAAVQYAAPPFHNSRIGYVDAAGIRYIEADILFLIDSYCTITPYHRFKSPAMRLALYEYLTRTCKGENPFAILCLIDDLAVSDILDRL